MQQATLLVDSQCKLGEGPFWYQQRCHWFDIEGKTLHSCTVDGSDHRTHSFPEMFSAAAELTDGSLLLASETGLWRYQGADQPLEKHRDLEADNALTRSNDGRADRKGGFWIGTMGKQLEDHAGAIYRYYRGELVKLQDRVSIPNAICFSPAGDYAYLTDTPERVIRRWRLDAAGWPVGEPEPWFQLYDDNANPDGAVVDSAGFLWNAQWGANQVVRYHPDGSVDSVYKFPTEQVSCPAFIGPKLDQLMVTTAWVDMPAEKREAQPLAGATFRINIPVPGLTDGIVQL